MVQKVSPFLQSAWGWDFGEGGWNGGMDANILKFSFMHEANVDAIVDSLPGDPTNGSAYFLTADKRFYFRVESLWYSCPCPKWFVFQEKTSGQKYQYDGVIHYQVPSESYLLSKFSEIENELSLLGSAAYEDSSSFATPGYVDVSVAGVSNEVDVLRTEVIRDLYSFGAIGDGVADDSAAVQAAVNSGCFRVSSGSYRLTTGIVGSAPVKILGDSSDNCIFIPDVGSATVKVFSFVTNDVHVEGVCIDGDGLSTTSTGNHYAFFSGDGDTKFKNHTYLNCQFLTAQFLYV